jgi:hypothetical protein
MRVTNPARLAVACLMAGALACASNTARVDDETAAAQQDTTNTAATQQDTANVQTPPGYSGMEQDTAMANDSAPTAVDTFLNEQGTGVPSDTQGYGGFEQPDTTGGANPTGYDTTGTGQAGTGYDTTGTTGQTGTGYDTTGTTGQTGTGYDTTSGMGQTDTSGMSQMDTTGMGTSQDTTR